MSYTGIFATILSDTSPTSNFPMFMNCCNYLLLSTYLFRQRRGIHYSSKCAFLKYIFRRNLLRTPITTVQSNIMLTLFFFLCKDENGAQETRVRESETYQSLNKATQPSTYLYNNINCWNSLYKLQMCWQCFQAYFIQTIQVYRLYLIFIFMCKMVSG
jgi:hypothetical protein